MCKETRTKYFAAEMTNSKYRRLAYKAFLSYVAAKDDVGGLGERFVIPSCVVAAIRNKFPSPDGKYTGFVTYKGQGKEALYLY